MDITAVSLRGAEGVFSTGRIMNNAYGCHGTVGQGALLKPAEPASPADGGTPARRSASTTT